MRKDYLYSRLSPHLLTSPSPKELLPLNPASVLVILHFSRGDYPNIVLTKRSSNLKSHTGEISFPGGRYAADDISLMHTALRETEEEIGIKFAKKDIQGSLGTVMTLTSRFAIVPFVTVQDKLPKFKVQENEVERILDVPLERVLKEIRVDKTHSLPSEEAYQFQCDGDIVWGATARIIKQLYDIMNK